MKKRSGDAPPATLRDAGLIVISSAEIAVSGGERMTTNSPLPSPVRSSDQVVSGSPSATVSNLPSTALDALSGRNTPFTAVLGSEAASGVTCARTAL
jgi:hypothetical protein